MPPPAPIPEYPDPKPINSVPLGDSRTFPEVKMDFPIADGPYQPTWPSINRNYPSKEAAWLREAKFGIWVHFGPQAAGKSGDWYARYLYVEGRSAYQNHLRDYGHPSETGYKDVLKTWNPTKLDPAALVQTYYDAGARFLLIQGVHHDQFDNWNSTYQPWNSVNMGPHRDIVGEWSAAAKKANMRFGVSFHHEYSWWWWQESFGADKTGDKAGIPYDTHETLADGKGKWWEGYDPRLLYGIDLREYMGFESDWILPKNGILVNHLDYCHWYATRWALRIMDVINKYDPDFIFTDGTSLQPFSGDGTGSGYKCDAMPRVIADYYNRSLKTRGAVDTFSIVKFHTPCHGVVTTFEDKWPSDIKTNQPWIGEVPNGDWFWEPGITNSAAGIIRYMIECVSRDGNFCVNIAMLPDGSLDEGALNMLKEIGAWMKLNGAGIYGSHAWVKWGEGVPDDKGNLHVLPQGKIGGAQANYKFDSRDFRFTVGKDGALYAFCMTIPDSGTELNISSLGSAAQVLPSAIKSVSLLGGNDPLDWTQKADGLSIKCPDTAPYRIALVFKIVCSAPIAFAKAPEPGTLVTTADAILGLSRTEPGKPNVWATRDDLDEWGAQCPANLIDGDLTNKYYNRSSLASGSPGLDTGFILTIKTGSTLADGIRFAAADDCPNRDPAEITIEGSNDPQADAEGFGDFTQLYQGTAGLETDPGRGKWGEIVRFSNNTAYKHYRVIVTRARDPQPDAVQYSEIQLLSPADGR